MWWLHSLFEDPQRSRTAGHSSTVLAFLRSPSALAFCRRPGAESPSRLSPHRGSTRRPSRPSRAACRPSRAACRPSRADVWSHSALFTGRLGPRLWGDWGLFQKATGLYTRATRPTLGATRGTDSRRQGRQLAGATAWASTGEKGASRGGGRRARRRESPAGRVPLGGASGSSPLPCAPPLPVRPLPIIPPSLTNRNMTVL